MKFLIDAQLPKSLSELFKLDGHDSVHTLELPKANDTKDFEIIKLCFEEKRIVITKDSYFLESFLTNNSPEN